MIATVRDAIDAGRVDLYLQPIVTLPQRKVRYYEAFTRLRTADGTVLQPSEFLDAAEAGGLMPRIDKLLLFRSVQVVRRLQLKNREIGLFCNVAASTLNDPQLFPEILQFMDANRALASSLMLELRQSTLRAMGPLETESLAALRELGFRFCMDAVTDLRMEPRDLGERGIRYVKVPASFLLDEAGSAGSDIHAADLSDLLGRYRHQPDRRADRRRGAGGRSARIRRALRPGLPVLAAAPGAGGGAARRRRDRRAPAQDDARHTAQDRRGRIGRSALIATPSLTEHFSTLAGGYDVVLSDVWGVIHNGVAATAARLRRADALSRPGRHGDADHQRAAAGRGGDAIPRQARRAAQRL